MNIKLYTILVLLVLVPISISAQDDEFSIPFNKGTLKICSSKNFKIVGHSGKDVIIRSISPTYGLVKGKRAPGLSTGRYVVGKPIAYTDTVKASVAKVISSYAKQANNNNNYNAQYVGSLGYFGSKERSKGLKKLGKKESPKDNGIYLDIEKSGSELIIKDDRSDRLFMVSNEYYEIQVPNQIKLQWNSNECDLGTQPYLFTSKSWELSNYKGEVEISSNLSDLKLTDVTGPVSINTVGANVTVIFDKTAPKELYSIYSNNGFIDISLPENSNVSIDGKGDEIFSDLPFKIVAESNTNGGQQLQLKMQKGSVKMKLDAGMGNVYLRKK